MKRAVYVSAKADISNAEKAMTFKKVLDKAKLHEKKNKVNPFFYTFFCTVLLLIPWFSVIGILAVFGLSFNWKLGLILYGVLAFLAFFLLRGSNTTRDYAMKRKVYNEMIKDVSNEKNEIELNLTTLGVEIDGKSYAWDEIGIIVEFENWLIFYTRNDSIEMFKLKDLKERKLDSILTILENRDLLYEVIQSNY